MFKRLDARLLADVRVRLGQDEVRTEISNGFDNASCTEKRRTSSGGHSIEGKVTVEDAMMTNAIFIKLSSS